jgi:hypothetical protein
MLKTRRSWARNLIKLIFSIELILLAALGPGVYSASNRNEYQEKILGSRARPVRKADDFTAIFELTF